MSAPGTDTTPASVAEAFRQGWALLARGQAQDAASRFEALLANTPPDGRAVFALGCARLAAGDGGGARAAFRAGRRQLQGRTGPLRTLALEIATEGGAHEAAALLRAIVALRPKWPIARADYGRLSLRAGRPGPAARQAAWLLRANLRPADAWRLQAASLFHRRRFAEAAQAFAELSRATPQDAGAPFAQARALALAGDWLGARAAAESAVEMAPDALRGRLLLARIAATTGNAALARKSLRAAVQLAPHRADLRARLAEMLAANAQIKAAMAMAASACEIDPENLAARLVLVRGHAAQGRRRKALALLDSLETAHPNIAELAQLRAEIGPLPPPAAPATSVAPPVAAPAPARGPAPGLPPPDIVDHLEILRALVLRSLRIKYRNNPLGIAVELLRPTAVVIAHYYLFELTNRAMPGHIPISVFVLGGFSVWFAFNAIEEGASHGGAAPAGAMALTGVSAMHLRVAAALWPLLFNLAYCLAALIPLDLYGADLPLPSAPLTLLVFAIVAVMGFGLGLTLDAASEFWPAFKIVGKLLTWILFVSAGLYFSLSDMRPPLLAEFMSYNPLLHLIEFERSAFAPGYPTALVSLSYPAEVAAALMLFGLVVTRCTRARN